MAKLPTYDEMAREVANKALDEIEYSGKTIRQWIDIIAEQPEIIRCKDCKYGVVDDPEIPFLRFCEYNGQDWNDENHYCGHAERREVNNESN